VQIQVVKGSVTDVGSDALIVNLFSGVTSPKGDGCGGSGTGGRDQ